eukprot:PhM_4_TR16467/c0_g1_i1/m.65116
MIRRTLIRVCPHASAATATSSSSTSSSSSANTTTSSSTTIVPTSGQTAATSSSDRTTPSLVGTPANLLMKNQSVRVSAFVDSVEPLGFGRVIGRIEEDGPDVFKVRFDAVNTAIPGVTDVNIDVGFKVWVELKDRTSAGIVTKAMGDGTFSVLYDDGRFDSIVGKDKILVCEGRPALFRTERFRQILHWVQEAGVERRHDAEVAAYVLCQGGWRKEKLYLLSEADISNLSHLHRSTRLCLLEMAEWEREAVRQRREIEREDEKENDWRYFSYKYSGVGGTVAAAVGVCSLFFWNSLNYHRNRREYQMGLVIHALTSDRSGTFTSVVHQSGVGRPEEEERLRNAFYTFDISHPRCLVVLGPRGAGKSSLCESVASSVKGLVHLTARVGWSNEDLLRNLAKSMGAVNVDTCGDLLSFILEALRTAAAKNGSIPTILLDLQFGENYVENRKLATLVFSFQRLISTHLRVAATVCEVDDTAVHINPAHLHEFDFHYISEFTHEQALAYLGRRVTEHDAEKAIQALGCNGALLDQMVSNMVRNTDTCDSFIRRMLLEAALEIRAYLREHPDAVEVVRHLSHNPHDRGIGLERYPEYVNDGVPNSVFHVNWQDRAIVINNKLLHTAAVHMFENYDQCGSFPECGESPSTGAAAQEATATT